MRQSQVRQHKTGKEAYETVLLELKIKHLEEKVTMLEEDRNRLNNHLEHITRLLPPPANQEEKLGFWYHMKAAFKA